jgi:hypothetical protein
MVSRYQSDPRRVGRISGPLLDRADLWSDDIHIDVPRVEYEKLSDEGLGEPSAATQARVEAARERQRRRFEGSSGLLSNADMGPAEVRDYCPVDDAGKSLLRAAMQQLHMSARAYDGLLTSPLHSEAGTHHRRLGGQRPDPDGAPGRGDTVSASPTAVSIVDCSLVLGCNDR